MKIDNPMAKADPDDSPRNTIADELHEEKTVRGYGRRQHGLNGKDADLDSGGQCVVESMYVYDDSDGIWIEAKLRQYASVCEPRDEENEAHDKEMRDCAEFIVMDFCQYSGEWTGSDYWSFGNSVAVRVEISDEEYDDDATTPAILDAIAERLVTAIGKDESVRAFEKAMSGLNKQLNDLHKASAK